MNRRRPLLAPAAVLLLVAAWALPLPDAPAGDEATYLLAAASVWHDGDLGFGHEDLARGYRTWEAGPRGVALFEDGERLAYARPFLYPVVAAPFYGALGPRGVRVLGVVLLLAVFGAARRHLLPGDPAGAAGRDPRADPSPEPRSDRPWDRRLRPSGRGGRILLTAYLLASGAAIWSLRFEPPVLVMSCAFFAVSLWCRVRCEPVWGRRELLPLAGTGVLLGAAALHEPLLGLLALPVVVDLLWARRWKAAGAFAVGLLAAGLALVGLQERLVGSWGAELHREATVYAGPFPLEARPGVEAPSGGAALLAEAVVGEGLEPGFGGEGALSPGLAARRALWLAAGRHVGLLPFFPFALFVLALYLADLRFRGGRARHLLAGTLLLCGVLAVLGLAGSGVGGWSGWGTGGAAAPGARIVALVYPVLLFLPLRLRGGGALLLPFAAAGLWVVPALAGAAAGARAGSPMEPPGMPAASPAYRLLPLELELLADGGLPGYQVFHRFPEGQGGPWLVPRESFFGGERHPDGVWVRGGSRSEVYVISRGPVEAVRFTARSIAADNELVVTGEERLRARFDTEGKRAGVPVAVRPELVARGLGLFLRDDADPAREERIYRLRLEVTGGAVPARKDPASRDARYLGVFLEL